ncbi:MAG: hypothetical protein H6Q03_2909 [Acidobacteria bacterium]|nr:hypothetical protein [Acidobacteriota bacterium]
MTAPAPTTPVASPPQRRRLRRLAFALLAAWVLYVAAFETAVRTGVAERLINRRPHKLAVAFESAHSWFPFWATASGIEARGQTLRLRWQAHVDRASGWLVPWYLAGRRIHLAGAVASGLELRLLRETEAGASSAPAPTSGAVPPERDLTLLPAIPPLAPPPPGPPRVPRWTIEVVDFTATGVRELWAESYRFTAEAKANGTLTLHLPTREIEVTESAIEFTAGALRVGDQTLAQALAGSADLSVSRYPYREERGLAALAHVSGRVTFAGRGSGGRFWVAALPPQEWLALDDRPAEVSGEVVLANGVLQPGTRVELRQDDYEARVFDFHLTGDVRGSFEVTSDAGGAKAEGRAGFHDYAIRRSAAEKPDLVGTGLTVVATTRDLQLADLANLRAAARVDLGQARVPDLSTLSDLMPPSAGIALVGGSGEATGGFDLELPALAGRGAIGIDLDDVAVRYTGLDLHGRMRLDLALATAALPSGRFDLAGSSISLTEFRSPQLAGDGPPAENPAEDAGWWARIDLPRAEIDMPPEPAANGQLRVHLRDSVPFIGLFETRRNLPRWVERMLTVNDLQAESGFAYRLDEFTLDEFSMGFKRATIRARTRFGPEHKTGILLVSWRKLNLGVRFDDDRRRFKLVGVRDWYAQQGLELSTAPVKVDPEETFSEEALAMVPFSGLAEQPLALSDAEAGEDEEEAGAAPFELVPGSLVRGDLDGDGREEAAVLLARPAGAEPATLFLAALDEQNGRPENLATLSLGPRAAPGRLRIEAGLVVLETPQGAAPGTPAAPSLPSEAPPAPDPMTVPVAGEQPPAAPAAEPTTPAPAPAPERWRLAGDALVAVAPSPVPAAAPAPAP